MKIHYIQPFRTDKNIGKSINDAINDLRCNDEDWIVHVDQDVCFLRPDSKKQIEEILSTTDCRLLGVMTNRLNIKHQLHDSLFSENDSIQHHLSIANERHDNYYGEVQDIKRGPIAAMVMCFKYSDWKSIGGFKENNIQFDIQFSDEIRLKGCKLGVMKGVYVFHLYRMWSNKDARFDTKHLEI